MQTLVIINNAAAKARRAWPSIRKQLHLAGFDYQSYETKAAGDATLKTRQALRDGVSRIAVVGGDGTLSEAVEGFFELNSDLDELPKPINPEAQLAILPAGTGDDFARGLRDGRASLRSWIDTLVSAEESTTIEVDVLYGRCDGFQKPFICLNASTMGIGGETAQRVSAQGDFIRRFPGEFRFVLAAVGAAGYRLTLTWDVDTIDWRPILNDPPGPTADEIVAKVLGNAQGGSIVLLHLGGYETLAALPRVVQGLRDAGFDLVSLDELL